MKLGIFIAKSGLKFWDADLGIDEQIVCEVHRPKPGISFWNNPRHPSYKEVVIIDRNITTALTQKRVAEVVRGWSENINITFAGNPLTAIASSHQHYKLGNGSLLPPKYLIAVTGLPATGKSVLRNVFSAMPQFSCYKWGEYAAQCVDSLDWDSVKQLFLAEETDKLIVANKFLESSGIMEDESTFAVVDGIKRYEQIVHVSYVTQRPVIVVKVVKDETERHKEAIKRGDFDDSFDDERATILQKINAEIHPDFLVNSTGCKFWYEGKTVNLHYSQVFVESMFELLSWLNVFTNIGDFKSALVQATTQVAINRGYAAAISFAEVRDSAAVLR